MIKKHNTIIKIITLSILFVLLSTMFFLYGQKDLIKVSDYFDKNVEFSAIENNEKLQDTFDISLLTGKEKKYYNFTTISLTCKSDIAFSKMTLSINSNSEEVIEIKIKKDLNSNEYLSLKTILLKPKKTLLIDIEGVFNFEAEQILYFEISGLQNISISSLKMIK